MARILMEPLNLGLVVERPHPSLDDELSRYGIAVVRRDDISEAAELIEALQETGAQVLFKRSRVPVTRDVIESCPNLHAVQLCCIGDDSVDKEACAEHGVLVFNDPVSNGRSVVELAVAHIIALSRRLYETNADSHSNRWNKNNHQRYEILDKRLGIVGLGKIGRQVARALERLGMDIWFYDNRDVAQEVGEEMGWTGVEDLATLFRSVDVVSVHASAFDHQGRSNEGLLDDALCMLGADRPGTSPRLFLNLARGNVHSAESLMAAVGAGQIRRAAVDVYPQEPGAGQLWENPYADEPRVVCTPHIGAATQEAQPRIARRVARTVGEFALRGTLRDCVFAPRQQLALNGAPAGSAVLAVVHSVSRGTKKAVADAIYEAEASTLASTQRDFSAGIAYDLSLIDRPLSEAELASLVTRAIDLADDATAIRAVRQVLVSDD